MLAAEGITCLSGESARFATSARPALPRLSVRSGRMLPYALCIGCRRGCLFSGRWDLWLEPECTFRFTRTGHVDSLSVQYVLQMTRCISNLDLQMSRSAAASFATHVARA